MSTSYSWSHSPSFSFRGSMKAKVQATEFRSRDNLMNPSRKPLSTSAATFSCYWTFVLLKLYTSSRLSFWGNVSVLREKTTSVRTESPNESPCDLLERRKVRHITPMWKQVNCINYIYAVQQQTTVPQVPNSGPLYKKIYTHIFFKIYRYKQLSSNNQY
jgi:hypothetical protein